MRREFTAILAMKLKQYYGPLRSSTSARISALLLYVILAGCAGGGALAFRVLYGMASPGEGGWLLTALSTSFSALMAMGVYLGLKGGITALQPEIDFVVPAPIKPSTYLLADLAFQLIFLNASLTPILAPFAATMLYPSPAWRFLAVMVAYEAALLTASALSHILGVLKATSPRFAKPLGWGLFAALLFPAAAAALNTPIRFLPYPSTLLAALALGTPDPPELALLMVYAALITSAYLWALKEDFFTNVTPLLTTAFMESPPSTRRFAIRSRWPRLARLLSLTPEGGSAASYMAKLHLVRVLRDGSMLTALILLGLFAAANVGLPSMARGVQRPELAALTLTILYIPLVPSLLSINWGLVERQNLWLTATTVDGLRSYVKGMLAAYILVALSFSAAFYGMSLALVGGTPFIALDLLLVVSVSTLSAHLAVLASLRFPRPSNALSHSSLLHILFPMAGTIILVMPTLAARVAEPLATEPPPLLLAALTVYTAAAAYLLSRAVLASISRLISRIGEE